MQIPIMSILEMVDHKMFIVTVFLSYTDGFSCQLNPDVNAFQRKFVNEVRRCEEMERKLSKWIPTGYY